MKLNVCLSSAGNEETPKWLEALAYAMCPTLRVTRHDFKEHLSLKRCDCQWPWSLMPLTIRGPMYITTAKANMSADMAESKPYTWTNCEEREKNVG